MTNHLMFPTPIMEDTIESDLEQYVTELSKVDKGVTHSNRGGYQSKHFSKPEKEFQDLWEKIEIKINEYHKFCKLRGHVQIVEWWFNINYKGGMNRAHEHPHSIHSGVYYIKTSENCGNLVFPHPNQTIMWGWGGLQEENNILNCGMVSFSPLKDSLFIFPSWCPHSVDTNQSDEPRISLSFNTGIIQ